MEWTGLQVGSPQCYTVCRLVESPSQEKQNNSAVAVFWAVGQLHRRLVSTGRQLKARGGGGGGGVDC